MALALHLLRPTGSISRDRCELNSLADLTRKSAVVPDHGGMQQVAFGPRCQRIKRPTCGQHQLMTAAQRIDPGIVEPHDGASIRAVTECFAVTAGDIDLVADGDVAQETEMCIAMRCVDGHAAFAGIGSQFDVTRTEGERLSAATFECDGAGMNPLHLDASDRPGIRPAPRF